MHRLSRSCLSILSLALTLSWSSTASSAGPAPQSVVNIHFRGDLDNSRIRFEQEKKGHIAFIGGSITEMNGYRPLVMEILQRRFPETEFTFTGAGISSTCSTTGAFRLERDVLSKGPVDLFFVEYAVNDDQDAGHSRRDCIRGLEGIIRQTRTHNPNADIVLTYFVNPGMLAQWQAGKTPLSVAAHETVAKHYHVSTSNLAKETADQITAGTLTWAKFGGTHPKLPGNQLAANMIDRLMSIAWAKPLASNATAKAHPLPDPIDKFSYSRGRLIAVDEAKGSENVKLHVPDWKNIRGGKRDRFVKEKLICADQAGDEITLPFSGTAIGAYVLAGPDAGTVEATVDDDEPVKVNLYHRYSRGLHYPRTVMFASELAPGKHVLKLRVSKDSASNGHAIRIMAFTAN